MGIWDIFAYWCNSVNFLGFILFKKWSNLSPLTKLCACRCHHDICRFTVQYPLTRIVKKVLDFCKGRPLSKEWFCIFSDVWTSKTVVGIPRCTWSDSKVMRLIFSWLYWQYCSLPTQTAFDLGPSSILTCCGMAVQCLSVEWVLETSGGVCEPRLENGSTEHHAALCHLFFLC